jgi:GNAT superfamily N-acetyltransferase
VSRQDHMEISVAYIDADSTWIDRLSDKFGAKAVSHLHFEDGFVIIAAHEAEVAGMISLYWRTMPRPLDYCREGYIDFIETSLDYRRIGIAKQLIQRAVERSCDHGVYQIRAWSSEDKLEAIPMWQSLGFGLAPAVVFHENKEIRGFYAVKVLERQT